MASRSHALLAGHTDGVESGCLSEDGLTLLTVAYDRSARVWDLRSGMCAAVLAPGGQAQARPLPKA